MKTLMIPAWYPNAYHSWGPYFVDQAHSLQKSGAEVSVLFPALYSPKWILKKQKIKWGMEHVNYQGLDTWYYYLPKSHISPWDRSRNLSAGKKLFHAYQLEKGLPDIVHVQSYFNGDLAIWIKETYGIPFVVTEHFTGFKRGLVRGSEHKIAKSVFQESSKNIAVSAPFCEELKERFQTEFVEVPNVVDLENFQYKPLPELNENQAPEFIFIGDLIAKKDPVLLMSAFARFSKKHPGSRLTIIGSGKMLKGLMHVTKKIHLHEQVDYLGHVDRQTIVQRMERAHALLSTSEVETFGVVVLEAMAMGRPVVSTVSGGPEVLVKKHGAGIVVEDRAPGVFALAMEKLLEQKFDMKKVAQEIKNYYSASRVGELILSIYQSVLEGQAPRHGETKG